MLYGERLDLEKIPYRFRLRWTDADGQEQVNTFRSWEVCQTWRQWRHRYGPDEVIPRMREQWLEKVLPAGREIRFFMGNLAQPKLREVFHVTGTHTTPKESTNAGLFAST